MANLISQITPIGQTTDYGFRASAVQYGTSSTGAGTAEKAVTCASFTSNYLIEGSIVAVKFSATNTAATSSLALNVNSTGAKPIKYIYNGNLSDLPSVSYLKQNQIYLFYYDGTNWVVLLNYDTNDVSSLEVINNNPTLAWNTKSTVGSVDGTELEVTMPAQPVTQIKGNAETNYRTGQVNLTPANLGISATTTSVTVGSTTFNKYTHPTTSGNKHIPSGGSSGQFLGWDSDGTAKWVNNPNVDTKVNVVARGTTKSYLMADTTSPTSTAGAHTAVAETGIYMTTTAGELNATQYKVNEAVTLQYNATTKSLDFIFA